jgi:cell division protein ZapE
MPAQFRARYGALVASGEIEADPAQAEMVERLARLDERLALHRQLRKSSALGWLFAGRPQSTEPRRGLYIHGEVGRGKTFLMDLFFSTTTVTRKRRAHFHEFMADVHERIHEFRKDTDSKEDPLARAAQAIASESWLLCFD